LDGYYDARNGWLRKRCRKCAAQPKFKNCPFLALTAKAMKGDMEKCIAAGANDYLFQSRLNSERLFSLLRVWFV